MDDVFSALAILEMMAYVEKKEIDKRGK